VGNKRHPDRRVIPCLCLALTGALAGTAGIAANPLPVRVQVTFVESIEVTVADSQAAGTADENLAITSSPGRLYTILVESLLENPDDDILTVSYQ